MADIRPFRGIHYGAPLLRDWSKVICPVYDIIPAGQNEQLYSRSPYNFVRLEAGRELPQDTSTANKYTRAAETFKSWLDAGVLELDRQAAIYLHDHLYTFEGKTCRRRSLVARVHLEEWDRMVVRPHESTFADARSDRLSLLWAMEANTSSILTLYRDQGGAVASVLGQADKNSPDLDLEMIEGEGHRVWKLTEPAVTGRISALFAGMPLYIADGHHRYESALAYRRQKRTAVQSEREEGFDFVMMTLVAFDDPGLLILPPHRLVRGISRPLFEGLIGQLDALFLIDEQDLSASDAWERLDRLRKAQDVPRLAVFGLTKNTILVLEPRDLEQIAAMTPYFHSDLYKRLEVSIIEHVVLEKLLGLTHEKDKVSYTYDRLDAIERVRSGEFQLSLILQPTSAGVIRDIADLGDKMPKKSTYFYPKVPAGLIVNPLT